MNQGRVPNPVFSQNPPHLALNVNLKWTWLFISNWSQLHQYYSKWIDKKRFVIHFAFDILRLILYDFEMDPILFRLIVVVIWNWRRVICNIYSVWATEYGIDSSSDRNIWFVAQQIPSQSDKIRVLQFEMMFIWNSQHFYHKYQNEHHFILKKSNLVGLRWNLLNNKSNISIWRRIDTIFSRSDRVNIAYDSPSIPYPNHDQSK